MRKAAYENMKEEIFMEKTVGNAVKGGSFLVEEITIDQVFTPEDFSSEHKMIAKTTPPESTTVSVSQVRHKMAIVS